MSLLRKEFCWLQICLAIYMQQYIATTSAAKNSEILAGRVLHLLDKIDSANDWNKNIKFALHLSEFLIKQKVRSYEPTRFEAQLFYKLMQKINKLISASELHNHSSQEKLLFKNMFHKDVLPSTPVLKTGNIMSNLEYESLLNNYAQLVNVGAPGWQLSDTCINDISSLSATNCTARRECIDVIISDLPTYGYQRMHQVLLLYLFAHHRCSTLWGSRTAYEILASERCSQVFREQNVIRSLGIPAQYKDLFLEQIVICGLFGYTEFLNVPNLNTLLSWQQLDGCFCLQNELNDSLDCSCSNHMNSLALSFYVNALLMLY